MWEAGYQLSQVFCRRHSLLRQVQPAVMTSRLGLGVVLVMGNSLARAGTVHADLLHSPASEQQFCIVAVHVREHS